MNHAELLDALDGLFAYDMGSTDSGIHDEKLRERAKEALGKMRRPELATFIRECYLSDASIESGYGAEDHKEFLAWLEDHMDEDLSRS